MTIQAWAYNIEIGSVDQAKVGTKIKVPIFVDSEKSALGGYDLTLSYNSGKLKYLTSVGIGPYFGSPQSTLLINDKQIGILKLLGQQFASLTAPKGRIQVAQLTFLITGKTLIKETIPISSTQAYNTDGENFSGLDSIDGTIQAGVACQFNLKPSRLKLGAKTNKYSIIKVTTHVSCSWTPISQADFLTVPSKSIKGSGTLKVQIKNNNTGVARTGNIVVGSTSLTVEQASR
jgi:hypothetical protein